MRKRNAHDDAYLRLASTRLTRSATAEPEALPLSGGVAGAARRRSLLLPRLALFEPRTPGPEPRQPG